jgi:hypothetical protein
MAAAAPSPPAVMTWGARGLLTLPAAQTPGTVVWPFVRGQPTADHGAATEIDQVPRDRGESRAGEEQVLIVEDWAEIRRLRRSSGCGFRDGSFVHRSRRRVGFRGPA